MTFEYHKRNCAVVDKKRNIILYKIGTWHGKNNEPRGGARFELQFPQGIVYSHLFLDERFPTPNSITLHWEINTISATNSLRGQEKEILTIFAEALRYYPNAWDPTHIEKITTDFEGGEQWIQFKESIRSRVHPMYVYTPTN